MGVHVQRTSGARELGQQPLEVLAPGGVCGGLAGGQAMQSRDRGVHPAGFVLGDVAGDGGVDLRIVGEAAISGQCELRPRRFAVTPAHPSGIGDLEIGLGEFGVDPVELIDDAGHAGT